MLRALFRVLAVAATLFFTQAAPAIADDSAAALAELRSAVDVATRASAQRWAFTLEYRDVSGSDARVFRVRFDPRKPAGARWSAIEPRADQYGAEEKKAFKRMTANDDADDALVYEGLAQSLSGAKVVSVNAAQAVFSIPIADPETPAAVAEALTAQATLDRKGGHVAAVEIRSIKPFKPASVAKIKSMRQLQVYRPIAPGGPVLMHASEADAEGSAMFKAFASKARLAYSEYEAVDAGPRAVK
ncbi:MAG: hypothetical protein ACKVS5_08725 [Parvularculaceae bacterium]